MTGVRQQRLELSTLLVATVLTQTALFMARPMTSYRVLELGGDAAGVGVVTACFSVLPLLVALSIGRFVDAGHGVLLLRIGIGAGVLAAAALALAQSVWQIALVNVVLGTGHLLNAVATQALLSGSADEGGQDRVFGAFTVAASAGQLLGPPIASLVAEGRGMQSGGAAAAILVAGCLAVLALCVVARLQRSPGPFRREPAGPAPPPSGSAARLLGRQGMVPAILASASLLACVDLLTSFLPVLAEDRGLGVAAVGWLLALRAATSMAARLFVHRMLRHVARRPLLGVSLGVSGLLLVALPWTERLWAVALVLAVAGFFLGIGQPLTMTWVVLLADGGSRATALALRLAGNRIGQVGVPGVGAGVAGAAGTSGVFWLMGGVLTLALVPVLRAPDPD